MRGKHHCRLTLSHDSLSSPSYTPVSKEDCQLPSPLPLVPERQIGIQEKLPAHPLARCFCGKHAVKEILKGRRNAPALRSVVGFPRPTHAGEERELVLLVLHPRAKQKVSIMREHKAPPRYRLFEPGGGTRRGEVELQTTMDAAHETTGKTETIVQVWFVSCGGGRFGFGTRKAAQTLRPASTPDL